jgi:class 3 adenylate cyclase
VTSQPSISATAQVAGERRYLTVMFCDLVGSTSISAQLDAEEWRDLVGAYLDSASTAVTEMGGRVAKKLGDGLMALFGYPVAQENDAERAARSALSIQRALAEVNHKNTAAGKPALNARIGIEMGPVVIDAAGEIYGDAPSVAARVQALAESGTVVVTARVQRQIAGLFVAEERGSHEVKGVPEPVTLFRLVRASGGGRRSGQRHRSSDRWRRAAGAAAASTGARAEVAVRIYLGAGDTVCHSWLRSDDRAGGASCEARLQAASSHAETCVRLCLGQPGTRYQGATSLPRAQKYPAHGALHRAITHAV